MSQGKTLYGLPEEVVHCKRCLMHNQKPYSMNETKHTPATVKETLSIDDDGVCVACRYAEEKDKGIDWEEREKKLLKMLEKYRRNDGRYDCIISGSGGKDSVRTAHMLKYKYGMNPLTVTWAPHLYTDVGWRNMQSWIHTGGFDNLLFTPNGQIMRALTREAFDNLYFPFQPFKFGIKFWATKMALKFGIDLVMYGEPYVEYGSTPEEDAQSPSLEIEYFVNDSKDIYLGGMHVNQIKDKYGFSDNDLLPYMPLRSHEIQNKGQDFRVEYLGWYVKWDPQETYYYAVENCGFEACEERTEGTYGKYSSLDDKIDGLHYFTSYIKFMVGRTRYDASQEIRNGHLTREEGIALLKKFEGEFPKMYHKEILDYMGITEEYFWERTDKARSPHLWEKVNGEWRLRHPIEELEEIAEKTQDKKYSYDV